jgi:hypothetical protein
MLYNMLSNNIITHTYENNLRIRSLLGNGAPGGGGGGGGGGGCDDCMHPALYIVMMFFIVFIGFYCLYFLVTIINYYSCRSAAVDVSLPPSTSYRSPREQVHCSNTEDDVLQSIVDVTHHTKPSDDEIDPDLSVD